MWSYLRSTHHPWPCLLFLLPLLVAYEFGVFYLGGAQADAMRNGADSWIRWGLQYFGVREFLAAPILILAVFLLWTFFKWSERPEDTLGIIFTMIFESIGYGLGLWCISQAFVPFLQSLGVTLGVQIHLTDESLARLVTFIGAGIYEETIFRLLLLNALVLILKFVFIPRVFAMFLAAVISSILFAAAHHIGEYGEQTINKAYFLFRVTAGLYFAAIYWIRGFGVAVGAHAMYDVMVGIPWKVTE
ncbi:CPBP family intramembrane metalloprotease [Telmatocola sphagniphila]|uniref:CPBP family intramembrane metalloprotease n=1 Tax=Telmatocola sphagniphila TaxID=1123043 RepID=A0A8E6F0L6_9BACT|nr:CPBP family intramembrane glutamic endopeptidase [Telmatocola sphagniphila]QVL34676.1 CPBP family intramembrane metalloprotease [Telmatocola sphagniphila]